MTLATSKYLEAPPWAVVLATVGGIIAPPLVVLAVVAIKMYQVQKDDNGRTGAALTGSKKWTPPVGIAFEEDGSFREEEPKGLHYPQGRKITISINVRNMVGRTVEDVEVAITGISPLPEELKGQMPLRLRFQTEESFTTTLGMIPKKVEVVSYFEKLWNCHIVLGGRSIYEGYPYYVIMMTASARGGATSQSFLMGRHRDGDLFLYRDSVERRKALEKEAASMTPPEDPLLQEPVTEGDGRDKEAILERALAMGVEKAAKIKAEQNAKRDNRNPGSEADGMAAQGDQ